MIITHKLKIDLARQSYAPRIQVVQDDKYSRNLEISFVVCGWNFEIPSGVNVFANYRKADGVCGFYDTLPNGLPAASIHGSVLTFAIAPQVCTVPGYTEMSFCFVQNETELNTFSIILEVKAKPNAMMDSEEYINVRGFIPQPSTAAVGQYLRVKSVDANGKILELETSYGTSGGASLPSGGIKGQALMKQSDADQDIAWGTVASVVSANVTKITGGQ